MKMMLHFENKQRLCNIVLILVSFLTTTVRAAPPARLEVPPCLGAYQRVFYPAPEKPTWTGCKDARGLYQGFLIQFSTQFEILRIASVKDSLRDGLEIRQGKSGYLEERSFENGHLSGKSFIFKTDAVLGRLLPKPMTLTDWNAFYKLPTQQDFSFLGKWLKTKPNSVLTFVEGRLHRMQFADKDYQFETARDGKIFSVNHSEMTKKFFTDPEPLWILNAEDLKNTLNPGWGSCPKYAGPVGRYAREYEHLLYKRETSESKYLAKLKESRDRFLSFCIPQDILENLGSIECSPQLPSPRPPRYCLLGLSDQLHLPYLPKYYKNEFTLGYMPEQFEEMMWSLGMKKFEGDPQETELVIHVGPGKDVMLKKLGDGIIFRTLPHAASGAVITEKDNLKEWWNWHQMPGH
jgi:hypothetical protein